MCAKSSQNDVEVAGPTKGIATSSFCASSPYIAIKKFLRRAIKLLMSSLSNESVVVQS